MIATFPAHPNSTNTLFVGGFVHETVDWAQSQKVCDADWLEKFARLRGHAEATSATDRRLKSSDEFFKNLIHSVSEWRRIRNDLLTSEDEFSAIKCRQSLSALAEILDSNTRKDLRNLATALDASLKGVDPLRETQRFLQQICRGHQHLVNTGKTKILGHDMFMEFSGVKSAIVTSAEKEIQANSLMDGKNPNAFAISYNPEILHGKNPPDSDGYGRASIVIGRQRNSETKECEFLIRNSYGPDCIDPTTHRPYVYRCENGSVWVPSKILFDHVENLVWIPHGS